MKHRKQGLFFTKEQSQVQWESWNRVPIKVSARVAAQERVRRMNRPVSPGPVMWHSKSYLRIEPKPSSMKERSGTPDPLQNPVPTPQTLVQKPVQKSVQKRVQKTVRRVARKPAKPDLINILSRDRLENYLRDHSITNIAPNALIDKVKVSTGRKRSSRPAHLLARSSQHGLSKLDANRAKSLQASHRMLQSFDHVCKRKPRQPMHFL